MFASAVVAHPVAYYMARYASGSTMDSLDLARITLKPSAAISAADPLKAILMS
jgi:hypothetical protein